jgi:uncharacterized protein YnzC (UPF0291/DUF896 family)
MWGIKIVKRYLLSIADFDFARDKLLSPKVITSGANPPLLSLSKQAIGGLLLWLFILLSGCTTTGKIADCETFVSTNRQVDTYFAKNTTDGANLGKKKFNGVAEQKKLAKEYLTFFLQSAETSTKAVAAIQGMSLKDEQLKKIQADYLSITKKTKAAIDRLAVISAEQNTSNITDAIVKDPKLDMKLVAKSQQLDDDFQEKVKVLGELGGEEGKVIDKVNAYCGQPLSNSSPASSPASSSTPK